MILINLTDDIVKKIDEHARRFKEARPVLVPDLSEVDSKFLSPRGRALKADQQYELEIWRSNKSRAGIVGYLIKRHYGMLGRPRRADTEGMEHVIVDGSESSNGSHDSQAALVGTGRSTES